MGPGAAALAALSPETAVMLTIGRSGFVGTGGGKKPAGFSPLRSCGLKRWRGAWAAGIGRIGSLRRWTFRRFVGVSGISFVHSLSGKGLLEGPSG